MIQARVKPDHRWNVVKAFSGLEFIKSEYRDVPLEAEEQAKAHPFLETREYVPPEPEPIPEEPKAKKGKAQEKKTTQAEPKPKAEKKVKSPEEKAAFIERMKQAKAKKSGETPQETPPLPPPDNQEV